MKELIDWLNGYNITEDMYDIIDGYVIMKGKYLNLSDNNITHLPECIGKLKVQTLYLSGNELTHLPESICNMKLEKLYLYNNNIPKEKLKYLDMIEGLTVCWTNYSYDLETNIILSKMNTRKDKIKLLLD